MAVVALDLIEEIYPEVKVSEELIANAIGKPTLSFVAWVSVTSMLTKIFPAPTEATFPFIAKPVMPLIALTRPATGDLIS